MDVPAHVQPLLQELDRLTRMTDMPRRVELCRQALAQVERAQNPRLWAALQGELGNSLAQSPRGDRADNLERAIQSYEQALQVLRLDLLPDDHRRTRRALAQTCFAAGRWTEAAAAYEGAWAAGELLYQAAATPEARQAELRELGGVAAGLAYTLGQTVTGLEAPANLAAAVTALERGRARWLGEALALGAEKPPAVPESAWQPFVEQRSAIQQLEAEARLPEDTPGKRDFTTLSAELRAARERLQELIAAIRAHAPDFMPAPTFAEVQQAAAVAPLVYLAVTAAGGLALVVQNEGVETVWLDGLTQQALRERVQGPDNDPALGGYLRAYDRWHRSPCDKAAAQSWLDTLDETAHWLGEAVIGPVVKALPPLPPSPACGKGGKEEAGPQGNLPRAVLIPQGLLGPLPLHAAWTEDPARPTGRRYALDEVALSYAPNARALAAAQEVGGQVTPETLLAVDEPQPVTAGPLPSSAWEVAAAADHFDGRQVLKGAEATAARLRELLPNYPVLHLSCHGAANLGAPLESSLLLAHDETLTLRDILALQLPGARLAVLSACETGIPGAELPDEVVSLPAGLVQAGVAGIVGTLWSVADVSTAMLMVRFYDLWRKEGTEPTAALRQAQIWLRDTTNAEKAAYFQRDIPRPGGTRMPAAVAAEFYSQTTVRDPEARDFAHPFYWAPFYLTGV